MPPPPGPVHQIGVTLRKPAQPDLDATLTDVSQRAGVGVGTAYRRFKTQSKPTLEKIHLRVSIPTRWWDSVPPSRLAS